MKRKPNMDLQGEYKEIPLELIETEGQQVRNEVDNEHVIELAISIAQHGLLQPIVLEPTDNGKYQLCAGYHRLCAFHRLARETIPAIVRETKTGPVKVIALVENIMQKPMTLKEQVSCVEYLSKEENLSTNQICEKIGKSTEWVNKRLMIPHLPEDVKQELMEGRLSIAHAEIIGRVDHAETRAVLLNQTIAGRLSSRQTEELTRLYLETPTIQGAVEAGLQKAEEIQTQKTPTRSCDWCGELNELQHLMFFATCPGCIATINRLIKQATQKGDNGHDNTG
jgi:ParB family chromosome partitioning protein